MKHKFPSTSYQMLVLLLIYCFVFCFIFVAVDFVSHMRDKTIASRQDDRLTCTSNTVAYFLDSHNYVLEIKVVTKAESGRVVQ